MKSKLLLKTARLALLGRAWNRSGVVDHRNWVRPQRY